MGNTAELVGISLTCLELLLLTSIPPLPLLSYAHSFQLQGYMIFILHTVFSASFTNSSSKFSWI